MLCAVTARTAAMMLARSTHAKNILESSFRPKKGLKAKNIPIATPPAMASGVSRIASSFSECSCNQRPGFMEKWGHGECQRKLLGGLWYRCSVPPHLDPLARGEGALSSAALGASPPICRETDCDPPSPRGRGPKAQEIL